MISKSPRIRRQFNANRRNTRLPAASSGGAPVPGEPPRLSPGGGLIDASAGTPVPMNDLWIAPIARRHKLPIPSRDAPFDHVAGVTRIGC
jgi:hypothetical protein